VPPPTVLLPSQRSPQHCRRQQHYIASARFSHHADNTQFRVHRGIKKEERQSKSTGTIDDVISDLSSNEEDEEDNYDEEVMESDTESDSNDVLDPGDNIEVVDSVGHTLTGRIMLAWKASCADLLHDFARAAFLFSPNPTVQEYVINNHVQADKDAAERLIAKWLLPEGTLETERSRLMASLVTTLWKEWGEFLTNFILFALVLK